MNESTKAAFFDRLGTIVLTAVLALTSLSFVPFLGLGVEVGKTYFVGLGLVAVLLVWIVARMVQGTISLPKSPIVTFAVLIPLTFLFSAFFSPAWRVSLGGLFVGTGSVVGVALFVLAFMGGAVYLTSERKITTLVKGLFIVTAIVTVFEIAYLVIGPRFLNLGTFFGSTSNLIGKWNDFAIWYGLVIVLAMMAFQFMQLSRKAKILVGILTGVSAIMLIAINFALVWSVLGFIALLVFIYSIIVLRNKESHAYTFPVVPFIVLVLSLFCFLANPFIGRFMVQQVGVGQNEIRPSVATTSTVVFETLKAHPFVGVGPERFSNAWNVSQPKSIIMSRFWNVDFAAGSGYIPTLFATTGILGGLAVIVFLVLFMIAGVMHLIRKGGDTKTHLYLVATFLTSVYLWILAFTYNPGVVPLLFTFLAPGIFLGILNASGRMPSCQIHFLKDPRHSFFAISLLVVLLLGGLFTLFMGAQKFVSLTLYARAQVVAGQNNLADAGALLERAIDLYPSDMYNRAHTKLSLAALSKLLSNTSLSKDIVKSEFQNIFGAAETSARQALAYDGTNADNWINLATLYQNVMPLQVTGAYENAKAALDQAAKFSPNNPDIDLLKARLEVVNKNTAEAKKIVKAALARKPNYIDGIFMLAELEAAGGDSATAISQLEQVALADPRNPLVFLQLGVFKYDAGDYSGAVSALERSITLDPTVLNTHYMLGLAYAKVGRTQEAQQVFTAIQKALPNNTTIAKIVANLAAGQDPLAGLGQASTNPLPETSTEGESAPSKTKTTTLDPKTKK